MDMIAWREGGQKAKKKEKKIHFFQQHVLMVRCTLEWVVLRHNHNGLNTFTREQSFFSIQAFLSDFILIAVLISHKYLSHKKQMCGNKKMENSPSKTILTHCLHLVGNLGGLKSIKNCGWGHVIWSKLKSTSAHFIKEACSRRWSRHNLASV